MSDQVKIVYRNILENSSVAVTTEDASFPKYRLCDRDIGKLFKGNAFASPFSIVIDQGADLSYEVDRLLIPVGHNFDGLACSLRYSTDNFVTDDHEAAGWTQADALLIDKSFTAQTKRYWKLNITAPATIVELPEMFLGKSYTLQANPLYGARQGRKRNIFSDQSSSGYDRDVKLGELRRVRIYEFKDTEGTDQAEFEALETLCEGIKPFWLEDHLGDVIFVKLVNEEDFGYDSEDGSAAYYSHHREFREVLGR
jgi:hypothetical protein